MHYFNWNLYALIYQQSPDGGCFSFQEDMETVSNEREGCVIGYKEVVDSWVSLHRIKQTNFVFAGAIRH
jgi:hypothetical protein